MTGASVYQTFPLLSQGYKSEYSFPCFVCCQDFYLVSSSVPDSFNVFSSPHLSQHTAINASRRANQTFTRDLTKSEPDIYKWPDEERTRLLQMTWRRANQTFTNDLTKSEPDFYKWPDEERSRLLHMTWRRANQTFTNDLTKSEPDFYKWPDEVRSRLLHMTWRRANQTFTNDLTKSEPDFYTWPDEERTRLLHMTWRRANQTFTLSLWPNDKSEWLLIGMEKQKKNTHTRKTQFVLPARPTPTYPPQKGGGVDGPRILNSSSFRHKKPWELM